MADPSSEIQIHVKGANELKLQITIKTDKTVQELKHAIAEKTDAPADRQRLIYSGKVLKDEEPLSNYKIQSGHTIHMVKSAAKSGGSSSTSAASPPPLPQMQAGQNPHDPLTQLNSHLGFGAMAGFNPFTDMGVNPNDPNMLQNMMNSPQFLQQMSSVFSNPQIMDQLMASNPQFRGMAPQMRQLFQSERFRQMMSNPETLRSMLQMSSLMHEMGAGPSAGGFPAMGGGFGGAVNQTNSPTPTTNPSPTQSTTESTNAPNTTPGVPPPNPFSDPAMMQQLMGMLSGPAGGGGLGGGLFGGPAGGLGGGLGGGLFGVPPTPADTRPPEERFQTQLQQLNDMGFVNASQNVRALLATNGNVQAAVEYILGGGGL